MNEETQNVEIVEEKEQVTAEPEQTPKQSQDEKKYTDAEVDEIINKKYAKWQAKREAEENEAKKLAKMNADEKRKYEYEQREKELLEREAEVLKKEMTSEAKTLLSERGLPLDLVAVVDLTSAETVLSSVKSIQQSFETAVQKAVEDRIKGGAPIKKAQEAVKNDPFDNIIENYK